MERDTPTPQEVALPTPLEVNLDRIPERLRFYPHFVVWKYANVDEEMKKPPFDPKTGKPASVRKPDTWGSFNDAQSAYETGQFAGVGIVLTADLGIVGIDIDHCIIEGQLTDEAREIIAILNSYTEASPSAGQETGGGAHIFIEAKKPGICTRRGSVEMYEDMRYLTLTGQSLANTPQDIQPRQQELNILCHRLFQIQENIGGVLGCTQVLTTSSNALMKPCCKKHLQPITARTSNATIMAIRHYGREQEQSTAANQKQTLP